MEPTNSNGGIDPKPKSRIPYSENATSYRDSASTSRHFQNSHNKDPRRERGNVRDRSGDRKDWSKEKTFSGRNRENLPEDEKSKEQPFKEELATLQPEPQTQCFSAYGYNATSDATCIDSNRRAMNMMSHYNFLAAMNPQWGMTPLDSLTMASSAMTVNPTAAVPVASGVDIAPNVRSGQINPYAYMSMAADPYSMMSMGNFGHYTMTGGVENIVAGQGKEVVHFSRGVLYPQNPNLPPPTRRKKPDGCRTVFVGGLPENATEEIVREVFERCGEIVTIRMSRKNFCHIRFENESIVESAMYFSGYRIKIDNKDERAYTGRLHVDYAEARDDKKEFEIQQRIYEREARHRNRAEQESLRPPTPPSVVHYSDHEGHILAEKLKADDTFQQSALTLITWLERGECNKRNANLFYSLIECTSNRVSKLLSEKKIFEAEVIESKQKLKIHMRSVLVTFDDVQKVFNAASLQKVWDHFTRPQRRQLDSHREVLDKSKKSHLEEVLNERIEVEMDCSDDENDNSAATDNVIEDSLQHEIEMLESENNSLRCQLEASQNEVALLGIESKNEKDRQEQNIQALRQTLQGMQNQVMINQKRSKEDVEPSDFHFRNCGRSKAEEDADLETCNGSFRDGDHFGKEQHRDSFGVPASSVSHSLSETEARWISFTSIFLNVHPFGASIDYICSYLVQKDCTIKARDIESLMSRFPSLYKEVSTGIGATLEKKWKYCGLE